LNDKGQINFQSVPWHEITNTLGFHSPPGQSRVKPMAFLENSPRYCTVVLTLWEERSVDPARPAEWRFRLEVPSTGERRGFATFKEMVVFLEEQMSDGNEAKKQEA
jgi:hypothetical protein